MTPQLLPLPLTLETIGEIWAPNRRRLFTRATATVSDVLMRTGLPLLQRRLEEDPAMSALFNNGMDAAMRTGFEGKRLLMGRIVSTAVLDGSKIDRCTLIYLAVRDLEAPHLQLLERLRREQVTNEAELRSAAQDDDVARLKAAHRERLEGIARDGGMVVNRALLSAGLTGSYGYVFSEGSWSNTVTAFGLEVVAFLSEPEG